MDERVELDSAKDPYILEKQKLFSQSCIWDLQQRYFSERGVEAWRQGEVPQYITSNPAAANSYAEIIFDFWREQNQYGPSKESYEPLYICELGAGSGRFAYHFLNRLIRLCEQTRVPPTSFRYVLTDFAQSNLDFWRQHPRFQAFFDKGILDIALFDINQSEEIALSLSGKTITDNSLDRPLVVIANYVFDSIPQELYFIDDTTCNRCLVTSFVDADPQTLHVAELLTRLQIHYDYQAVTETIYPEPDLEQILIDYQHKLMNTHLLFPAAGLRCLRKLKSFSKQGLLVLSADKGNHRLSAMEDKAVPPLVRHGSFSLNVNYHAYKVFCEQTGGIALFPDYHPSNVNMSCLLMIDNASDYVETQRAYQRHVQDFSPDDFYSIAKHAKPYIDEMSVYDLLAYLRLSYYDSHQFMFYLPRLMKLAPELVEHEKHDVRDAADRVWQLYFPLGETLDLAYQIACLLYEMDDYPQALIYFERSNEIYGPHSGTFYNMAVCYQLLNQDQLAESFLHKVLEADPHNEQARIRLAEYTG